MMTAAASRRPDRLGWSGGVGGRKQTGETSVRRRRRIGGHGPVPPLVVLFGLNAVDELDRSGLELLAPEIRDEFGIANQDILALVALERIAGLLLELPIAYLAERRSRVRLAALGAAVWAVFSLATGLSPTLALLALARLGGALGRATTTPTHLPLLADYYAAADRPRAYGIHRAANPLGQFLGPLAAGTLALSFGWRAPFLVFGLPTLLLVLVALRLREPPRGAQERGLTGAGRGSGPANEPSPGFLEAARLLWRVRSLRRIWFALPFVAILLAGLSSLFSIFYAETFGLDEAERGFAVAIAAPAQVVGLLLGIPFATRLLRRSPALVLRSLGLVGVFVSACFLGVAAAPTVAVAVVLQALVMSSASLFFPGVFTILSLVLPPRVRSLGFSISALWFVPGLLLLPAIGSLADAVGPRLAIASVVPSLLVAGAILATAGRFVTADIEAARRSVSAVDS